MKIEQCPSCGNKNVFPQIVNNLITIGCPCNAEITLIVKAASEVIWKINGDYKSIKN